MNKNTYKYICLASTIIFGILMFTKWFTIDLSVGVENHSFLTIPDLINAPVDFLKSTVGVPATFAILMIAGILEYLCFVATGMGVWGIIRTFTEKRKSRLIFVSQCTALSLVVIAIMVIVIIDVISASSLGGIISVYPTIWFVLTVVFLTASMVCGYLMSERHSKNEDQYPPEEEGEDEAEESVGE